MRASAPAAAASHPFIAQSIRQEGFGAISLLTRRDGHAAGQYRVGIAAGLIKFCLG